jgi:predicted RecB family nuclease
MRPLCTMTSYPAAALTQRQLDELRAPNKLSKSRFTAGTQCHKLLWWRVHEPLALELQPDKVLQDRFDQGALVGALARERFVDSVLIRLAHRNEEPDRIWDDRDDERLEMTRQAMEGANTIFEGSFFADNTFVTCDILQREDDGWRLIEVKSTNSAKEEHHLDAAIQVHVLELSGVNVTAVEIMHLNKECHFPDLSNLFERTVVTDEVRALLPDIHNEIEAQLAMLRGPLPDVAIGLRCSEPRDCAFQERCWPNDPDHISNLYNIGRAKRCQQHFDAGIHRISQLPTKKKPNATVQRQIRAMKEQRLIVESNLTRALEVFEVPLGFLDFETISRAVPVWPGMNPWQQAPAQFSYHETNGDGTYTHAEFLAEGPDDTRRPLVQRMIEATARAERVVMYSHFEKTQIRGLQDVVPEFRPELIELENKLIDLLPVLRDHVYHPDFHGSFSIKSVLTPLVPELTYNDLVIVNGLVASVEIARLLFVAGKISPEEVPRVRKDLLEYCKRDTWAMVKLLDKLRALA